MNNFKDPKDFHESIKYQQLSLAFREMYLLIRALHMQTEPDSFENNALLIFFKKIMKSDWHDENEVEKLILQCQILLSELSGEKKKTKENVVVPPSTPRHMTKSMEKFFKNPPVSVNGLRASPQDSMNL
jgi:hypothetical protein